MLFRSIIHKLDCFNPTKDHHHVRDELPPLLNQSAAHRSLLLVERLIQSLPHHHELFLGLFFQLVYLLCRYETPSGGENNKIKTSPA